MLLCRNQLFQSTTYILTALLFSSIRSGLTAQLSWPADSQAEPLYNNNGKAVSEDSFPDAVKPVNASNDASSGQVKKGSNANPEGAPDATWWLRDVNMNVGPGELVCVVGRVGSGKSSLIGALLGEAFHVSCIVLCTLCPACCEACSNTVCCCQTLSHWCPARRSLWS